MSEGVKFGTSMFGYDKADVELYLETLVEQCQHKIDIKDKEIADIRAQINHEKEEMMQQLQTEADAARRQLAQELEEARFLLSNEVNTVRTQLEEEASKVSQKDREISILKDTIRALNDQLDKAKTEDMSHLTVVKDQEINNLKNQVEELESMLHDKNQNQLLLAQKNSQLQEEIESLKSRNVNLEEKERTLAVEREKITRALILASEKAENIVAEANEKASHIIDDAIITSQENRKELEELVEREREKLVDVKREMHDVKASFVGMLKKYEQELDKAAGEI